MKKAVYLHLLLGLLVLTIQPLFIDAQIIDPVPNRNEPYTNRLEKFKSKMDELKIGMQEENDTLILQSYQWLSRFYTLISNKEKAKYYKNLELNYLKKLNPYDTLGLYSLEVELFTLEEYERDSQQLLEILRYALHHEHEVLYDNAARNYVSLLMNTNRFKEYANFYLNEFPELLQYRKKHDPPVYYRAMSIINEVEGEIDSAIYYVNLEQMALQSSSQHNPYYKAFFYYRSGQIYRRLQKENIALERFNRFLQKSDSLGYIPFMIQASKQLMDMYKNREQYDSSLKYAEMAIELKNEMESSSHANALLKIEMEKESQLAELELESIRLKNQANMKIERFKGKIIIGIGLALLILIIGLWNRYRFVEKSRKRLRIEKRRTELEKQRAEIEKKRAEESEAFRQQFLASMSHEIRTPMNAIIGMTDLVLNSTLEPKQKSYVEGIQKSSANLLHLINEILDLSKIEAGKMELEEINFSMKEVLDQVNLILEQKAKKKGLDFITSIQPEVDQVYLGDPFRIIQVLLNLIGNAIKFTDKGSVQLLIEEADSKNGDQNTQAILFKVIDSGIGIPQDKLDTVFKSFVQAHTSDTRNFGGTGLGLSISQELVKLMHGQLNLESEEGIGTTFSVRLELPFGSKEKMNRLENQKGELEGKVLNGLKILLVDDNEFNRIVARDTLEANSDVKIVEVVDGLQALNAVKKESFDVVLMDIQMPVMNGYEATQRIRDEVEPPLNKIPIIALTASVLSEDLKRIKESSMDYYIPKPFKSNELIQGIADTLGIEYTRARSLTEDKANEEISNSGATVSNLDYLRSFCEGDEEKMKKYIDLFITSVPNWLGELKISFRNEDYTTIANQVHGYKPRFTMMGMKSSKDISVKLEDLCRNDGAQKKIEKHLKKLMESVKIAERELGEFPKT